MKVLLVRPYPELKVAKALEQGFLHLEPLDLEIVAGGVKDAQAAILDLSFEKKPLEVFAKKIKEYAPDILGFGGYSSHNHVVKNLAATAKALKPDIFTIVGGIHATIAPMDYKIKDIDAVVRGEGATVINEIITRYKNKMPVSIAEKVFLTADPAFEEKVKAPLPVYPQPQEIPLPRRDLVSRERYFCVWTHTDTGRLPKMFPPTASLRTSMGCAFNCSFCVVHHLMRGKYLQRAPEDVVAEIENIKEEYIYFVDDEMFLNAPRAQRIAELLLEKKIKKRYSSWSRADTIVKYPELFKLWKQAGLDILFVGMESLDPERLKEYSKRAGVEANNAAVKILKDLGIMLHAAFIVHPDFTPQDFGRLEEEIRRITPAEITFTVLSPSPGTKFWEENKGRFICDPYRFYDCMHSILPVKLPLQKFYQHFGRLTQLALRANPLRVNNIRVPFKDFIRAIVGGTRYIFSLYTIYKDYPKP